PLFPYTTLFRSSETAVPEAAASETPTPEARRMPAEASAVSSSLFTRSAPSLTVKGRSCASARDTRQLPGADSAHRPALASCRELPRGGEPAGFRLPGARSRDPLSANHLPGASETHHVRQRPAAGSWRSCGSALGAAVLDGVGKEVEHAAGVVPAEAAVGDALAVGEGGAWNDVLAARDEKALEHDAEDRGASAGDLVRDRAGDLGLA